MDQAFQKWFYRFTNNALLRILISLNKTGSYSNGTDGISIQEASDGGISVWASWLQLLPNCTQMNHRFSVPKFLDLLEKRKKEYIALHPHEKEAVDAEFESFRKNLLKKWASA